MPFKLKKQYRLPGYDYSQNGYYFITIVTKGRVHHFGEIKNNQMLLTDVGVFAFENIRKFIPRPELADTLQFHPHVLAQADAITTIEEFQIMPNHIHLIVGIMNRTDKDWKIVEGLQPLSKGSISSFINHFKGKVKRWCVENCIEDFDWQSRFHDRIIRDEEEYHRIVAYIRNNVANWQEDAEYLA